MERRTTAIVLVIGLAILLYMERETFSSWFTEPARTAVPSARPYEPSVSVSPKASGTPTQSLRPSAGVNLAVPFVSQAPFKVWDEDHEEFCEEAAALMAASYIKNDRTVTDPATADARLYAIKNWEMANLGFFKDTTAAETLRILKEHLGIDKSVLADNPTVTQIKNWLDQGRIVLVPSAGRMLGNPNFTAPGPLYHMLVIKGYTKDGKFITNDPGTRKGADYIYEASVLMDAMHDWNGGQVDTGAKVVIVVG